MLKHDVIPHDTCVESVTQKDLEECHADHQQDDEAEQRCFEVSEEGVDTLEQCHLILNSSVRSTRKVCGEESRFCSSAKNSTGYVFLNRYRLR